MVMVVISTRFITLVSVVFVVLFLSIVNSRFIDLFSLVSIGEFFLTGERLFVADYGGIFHVLVVRVLGAVSVFFGFLLEFELSIRKRLDWLCLWLSIQVLLSVIFVEI